MSSEGAGEHCLSDKMEQDIDHRVKELIRDSLYGAEVRVSLVVTLLKGGMFEQALEHSLPLIGTEHTAWFLYARAWHNLAHGKTTDALRLLRIAYGCLREEHRWEAPTFSFTEQGKPRLVPPFHSPLAYSRDGGASGGETEALSYAGAIFHEDWLELLTDIGRNIREYKELFITVVKSIEKVIHHDVETVSAAVPVIDLDEADEVGGGSFLMLTLMSNSHLRMVTETLWRICADWNFPLYLCEIVAYLAYLQEDDDTALEMSELGLQEDPGSLVCGNVRALAFNRQGKVYLADEQWRETLLFNPDRSATYLVLGHQALCSGGLDPALRYFQEALLVGDNRGEAHRFFLAALECLGD